MHPHLFPTISLSFVVITITLIHFPFSSYATEQYQECSAPFECAGIKNLSYPFWGPGRPSYCGHPAFELNCSGEDPLMKIKYMNYRVLEVNSVSRTLKVAREDYWNKFCPASIVNTTIDFTIFSYSSGTTNLTIYYGCPFPGQPGSLICPINGTELATYTSGDSIVNSIANTIGACQYNVKVPVLQSVVGTGFNFTEAALIDAIDGGFMLGWNVYNDMCSACQAYGGLCGYNTSTSPFACYCANGTCPITYGSTPPSGGNSGVTLGVGIGIGGAGLVGIFLGAWIFSIMQGRKKRARESQSKGPLALPLGKGIPISLANFSQRDIKHDQLNIEEIMKNFGSIGPKRYTYSDVKKLTNSFKEKVGHGGYGIVYKGKLCDGGVVAVKILNEFKGNGEEFINEVASISRTSHVNIVTLLGFCYEKTKKALIYEFMQNGSLDKLIYGKGSSTPNSHLDSKTMFQIAIGVARGLEYLHRGCNTRILHFDIKPHNILLDEDLCPKISDFGLAKLCKPKESIVSMTGMRGTAGYIAPEVFNRYFGRVSHKSDVYSYGMLVLEMNGARKMTDTRDSHSSEVYFPDGIYNKLEQGESFGIFEDVAEEEEDIIKKMIMVSLWCIQINPLVRPSMGKVIEMLEGPSQSLQVPSKPFFDSPVKLPQDSSMTSLSQNLTFQMPLPEL